MLINAAVVVVVVGVREQLVLVLSSPVVVV